MGYNLTKRLDLLTSESKGEFEGRLKFFRVLLLCFFSALIFASVLGRSRSEIEALARHEDDPASSSSITHGKDAAAESAAASFQHQVQAETAERIEWLASSWVGSFGASAYRGFSRNVISALVIDTAPPPAEGPAPLFDLDAWSESFYHLLASILLRVYFVFLTCLPLWIAGGIAGVVIFHKLLKPKRTSDMLGVLARGHGPFYSGFYGPLIANNSYSGTDLSAPGLACPKKAALPIAAKHQLMHLLNKFGANNETNTELVRIILAYADYPTIVDEERVIEEESDDAASASETSSQPAPPSLRTNEDGTIEQSTLEGLLAVLSAHHVLTGFFMKYQDVAPEGGFSETHFQEVISSLRTKAPSLPPLGQQLLLGLTPERGLALSGIPAAAVASAYLATEAGKSLVYQHKGAAYAQISRFPHLQARAVLHSVTPYHREYPGDIRLNIRQAIICSRRHGDFGRAFFPVNMPVAARALRDWLETLYAAPKKREDVSHLAELDAHIEEIMRNWRQEFKRFLENLNRGKGHDNASPATDLMIARGLVYKSVVLVPLTQLVEIALRGISRPRIERVGQLIDLTRKLQASLSISARLPGFKRQAVEAEKGGLESGGVTRLLAQTATARDLVQGWLIIRRMLTRYNWLSTRVGDDAVPVDGLVEAVLINRKPNTAPEVLGLNALVPLRQRRFKELFGVRWEGLYYAESPHPDDIEVYVDNEEYTAELGQRREDAKKGLLDRVPPKGMDPGSAAV